MLGPQLTITQLMSIFTYKERPCHTQQACLLASHYEWYEIFLPPTTSCLLSILHELWAKCSESKYNVPGKMFVVCTTRDFSVKCFLKCSLFVIQTVPYYKGLGCSLTKDQVYTEKNKAKLAIGNSKWSFLAIKWKLKLNWRISL